MVHQQQQKLLDLPVVCLATACFDIALKDIVKGKRTFIDFWTTQCTRCPAALDKLNTFASRNNGPTNQFLSICCDSLDGAREILERPDDAPAWNSMKHYFMAYEDKEKAKRILGFRKVPFYVVVDAQGSIVYTGNKLPEEDRITGSMWCDDNETSPATTDSATTIDRPATPPQIEKTVTSSSPTSSILVIEELDF